MILQKLDANDVGSGLGSVRKTVVMFNDMPMISYDYEKPGWHHVYNGILSPFANKYKVYIKTELKSRAQEKEKQDSYLVTSDQERAVLHQKEKYQTSIIKPISTDKIEALILNGRKKRPQKKSPASDISKKSLIAKNKHFTSLVNQPKSVDINKIFEVNKRKSRKYKLNYDKFIKWSEDNLEACGRKMPDISQSNFEKLYYNDHEIIKELFSLQLRAFRRRSCICEYACNNVGNKKLHRLLIQELLIANQIKLMQIRGLIVDDSDNKGEEHSMTQSHEFSSEGESDDSDSDMGVIDEQTNEQTSLGNLLTRYVQIQEVVNKQNNFKLNQPTKSFKDNISVTTSNQMKQANSQKCGLQIEINQCAFPSRNTFKLKVENTLQETKFLMPSRTGFNGMNPNSSNCNSPGLNRMNSNIYKKRSLLKKQRKQELLRKQLEEALRLKKEKLLLQYRLKLIQQHKPKTLSFQPVINFLSTQSEQQMGETTEKSDSNKNEDESDFQKIKIKIIPEQSQSLSSVDEIKDNQSDDNVINNNRFDDQDTLHQQTYRLNAKQVSGRKSFVLPSRNSKISKPDYECTVYKIKNLRDHPKNQNMRLSLRDVNNQKFLTIQEMLCDQQQLNSRRTSEVNYLQQGDQKTVLKLPLQSSRQEKRISLNSLNKNKELPKQSCPYLQPVLNKVLSFDKLEKPFTAQLNYRLANVNLQTASSISTFVNQKQQPAQPQQQLFMHKRTSQNKKSVPALTQFQLNENHLVKHQKSTKRLSIKETLKMTKSLQNFKPAQQLIASTKQLDPSDPFSPVSSILSHRSIKNRATFAQSIQLMRNENFKQTYKNLNE
ncbi:UNKNOWN [Stylonychia lemnae]|uniref:Uncharacterized protein n=1 Tax=Stylonychia lemnae TaxID=5949 RepID=A0A078A553_STYLE|nr:UNKNOWN [Stylonychia lemnae]|eukprot:CDW75869.1 UNKNOWN [Stylonychia lemnae]